MLTVPARAALEADALAVVRGLVTAPSSPGRTKQADFIAQRAAERALDRERADNRAARRVAAAAHSLARAADFPATSARGR